MRPHLAIAVLLALTPAAFAQSGSQPADLPVPAENKVDTATFARMVESAGRFEIDSSRLAEQKNIAADVKDFAALMVRDHTRAGEDFKVALDRSHRTATVSPDGPALLPREQAMLDQFEGLDGDAFQAKYILLQSEAHKQAVALFSTYAQSGEDPALKEFAKKTLPTLRLHEKHIKELAAAHS